MRVLLFFAELAKVVDDAARPHCLSDISEVPPCGVNAVFEDGVKIIEKLLGDVRKRYLKRGRSAVG